jgi:Fe2+ or Zn2+ uptake regulation protein
VIIGGWVRGGEDLIDSRKMHQTSAVRYWDNHRVVCRSCGAVADLDCAVAPAPCLDPSDDHGFVIDEAEVVFRGLCPGCSATR